MLPMKIADLLAMPIYCWMEERTLLRLEIMGLIGDLQARASSLVCNQVLNSLITNCLSNMKSLSPVGEHSVTVEAEGYLPTTRLVTISAPQFARVMFRLTKDESVMGMPRLVFIMFAGEYLSIMN